MELWKGGMTSTPPPNHLKGALKATMVKNTIRYILEFANDNCHSGEKGSPTISPRCTPCKPDTPKHRAGQRTHRIEKILSSPWDGPITLITLNMRIKNMTTDFHQSGSYPMKTTRFCCLNQMAKHIVHRNNRVIKWRVTHKF
jgi:hypothetical protein